MNISIRALRYFLAAAERGSISKAAAALNIAPSAISHAIDQVETEFALKLVQRFPAKGISPTAAGLTLMRKIRSFVDEYELLLLEGAELRTALTGKLSIGYYAPIAPAFLPEILGGLMRDNPGIEVHLGECDNEAAQAGLVSGVFDVIVFVAESPQSGLTQEPLLAAPPYLLTPVDHALAARDFVSPDDLAAVPLVVLDVPVAGPYYREIIASQAPGGRIVATATSTEMVRSLVAGGMGCALLNMCPRTTGTYAGPAVAAVPIRPRLRPLTLALGHLGGRPRRLSRVFIDACRAYLTSDLGRRLIVT